MAQIPKTQYQVTVEPISTRPETTTVDRWFSPLSVPSVLSKPGLKTSEHPAFFWHISTAKETTTVDRWWQPLSQPYPAKVGLNPALQQAHTEPVSIAKETTTLDRWFAPLSAPITPRQVPMAAAQQLAHTEPISEAPETTSLDRWYQPFSTPTPPKAGLAPAQQQAHTEPVSEAKETVTVDRWLVPLSQPVFVRALPVACAMDWQAWSTFTPVILAVTVASWFEPFSTPMPVLSRVAMMPPPTGPPNTAPETTSLDRWFSPLSTPPYPRQLPFAAAQQLAFTAPVSESPETTTVDRWWQPLSLPTPAKAGLLPAQQQALAWNTFTPANTAVPSFDYFQPLSTPPPPKAALAAAQQQAHTEPLSEAPETTSVDRWFAPLSVPSVLRFTMAAAQQSNFWWSTFTPATVIVVNNGWFVPLSTPTPAKAGLLPAQQQAHTEPVSLAKETVTIDRWLQPLSVPSVLSRAGLLPGSQQVLAEPLSEAKETTSLDRWFAPLSTPPAFQAPRRTAEFPAHTEPVSLAKETTTLDRWYQPLSVPVRRVPAIPAGEQRELFWSTFTPAVSATTIHPGVGSITITGFPPTITVAPFPFHFGFTNAGIFMEAFDRLQIRPHDIDRHMMQSAVTSLNEALQDWTNETQTMWSVVSGTINLVPGQVTYALPSNLAQLFDVAYVTNASSPAITSSVLMAPMQRSHYAALANKLERGVPKYYWFQMLVQPQITIWQAPDQAQTLQWWGLQRLQDARIGSGETPNIPYRGFDALCANLAARLCEKVGKPWMQQEKTLFAKVAWEKLQRRDQELGTTEIRLMTKKYRRIR